MTGTECSGRLRLALPGTGPAVTLAISPHVGQAPAAPSNEKQQPQKHATSVIIGTFFLCARCRTARPADDGSGTGASFSDMERAFAVLIPQRQHRLFLSLRHADPSVPGWRVTQRVSAGVDRVGFAGVPGKNAAGHTALHTAGPDRWRYG